MTKAGQYGDKPVADYIHCNLFDSRALAIASMNASKIGIVVITVERYFKVNSKSFQARSHEGYMKFALSPKI